MVRNPVFRNDDEEPEDEFSPDSPSRAEDERFDDELRPQYLTDVVGQRDVVERVGIMLAAAKKRGEPLGHLLLDGPPGLGKTTLATVIPRELGADMQMTAPLAECS